MIFPDLDGADQFLLVEVSGALNTQMPGHLPDFSHVNQRDTIQFPDVLNTEHCSFLSEFQHGSHCQILQLLGRLVRLS